MTTDIESLWIFALVSKCKSLTTINLLCFFSLFALFLFIINLFYWFHPGGPAWGKHKWTKTKQTPSIPIPGPKGLPVTGSPSLMSYLAHQMVSALAIAETKKTASTPIPGPKGLPVIGSLSLMSGLAHQKVSAVAETFKAKRLMAMSLGETRLIVTCNPDVAKEILNSTVFADRPVKESAYSLMFNKAIGFAPYGVYWRTLRKIAATHLFSPKQIKASEPQRIDIAHEMVVEFNKASGAPVCVREIFKVASLHNIMCSVFGKKFKKMGGSGSDELRELVDEGYELLGSLNWSDHLSFLGDLDLQRIRFRCLNLVPRVNEFVGEIIEDHRRIHQRNGSNSPEDFVDVMLSLQGGCKLSDSDIIAVLWEMVFRGTDTVAVLMEWILARLVLHPQVQKRVHEELDRVVGRTRALAESDLTELVYLTAVIKEVLRLHPPGPLLSWARLAVTDTVVDGYHVPKGTTAMVNMWSIMRDPEVWVDPLEFNPDRFLNNDMDISIWGSDLRIAPFGSGRRTCPGKNLAMTTVTYWVGSLLHEFEFESCQVDLSEVLRLSCEMVNPLMVKMNSRKIVS